MKKYLLIISISALEKLKVVIGGIEKCLDLQNSTKGNKPFKYLNDAG